MYCLRICDDCKENHKCGISCETYNFRDEGCKCSVTEIEQNLYFCKACKLVIPANRDAFKDYFYDAIDWFYSFLAQDGQYVLDLERRRYMAEPLGTKEKEILEIAGKFYAATQDFPAFDPGRLTLRAMDLRRKAYRFILAFRGLQEKAHDFSTN